MEKVFAPFTPKQVEDLRMFQNSPNHEFTCCGGYNGRCTRPEEFNHGSLIPNEKGWICPCGKYTQDWCWKEMLEGPMTIGGYIVEDVKRVEDRK